MEHIGVELKGNKLRDFIDTSEITADCSPFYILPTLQSYFFMLSELLNDNLIEWKTSNMFLYTTIFRGRSSPGLIIQKNLISIQSETYSC